MDAFHWALLLIISYIILTGVYLFYTVFVLLSRHEDNSNPLAFNKLKKTRRQSHLIELKEGSISVAEDNLLVSKRDQKINIFILLFFDALLRISVIVGGIYRAKHDFQLPNDSSQEHEILENLPGFLNVAICAQFVVNSIQFVYGRVHRQFMILVLIVDLIIAAVLLTNDYIALYFPLNEIEDKAFFYLITFACYLFFCVSLLFYLLFIVIWRVRARRPDIEYIWKSKTGAVIALSLLVLLYGFRSILVVIEAVKPQTTNRTTFNYSDVHSSSQGGIFFSYYFFGEVIPAALMAFLCIIISQLHITTAVTTSARQVGSHIFSLSSTSPTDLLKKLKTESPSTIQTYVELLITNRKELVKFQTEEIIQQIMSLAESNKVMGYLNVTLPDPKKSQPRFIDHGRYRVYEVSLEEFPRRKFAAKFIPEDCLDPGSPELNEFSRDATCLSLIAHENVCRCIGVAKLYIHNMDYRAIVMERMETDLFRIVEQNAKAGTLPRTRDALIFAIGIARGVAHLHKMGVIHRDLKTKNVLISADSIAKITDFGQARPLGGPTMTPWDVGTPPYTAPEIANRSASYEKSSDVYSFGVILLELFFQGYFKRILEQRYTFRIGSEHESQINSSMSVPKQQILRSIAKLITDCGKGPRSRPTIQQIVHTLEKLAGELYPMNEKIQRILASDGRPKETFLDQDFDSSTKFNSLERDSLLDSDSSYPTSDKTPLLSKDGGIKLPGM